MAKKNPEEVKPLDRDDLVTDAGTPDNSVPAGRTLTEDEARTQADAIAKDRDLGPDVDLRSRQSAEQQSTEVPVSEEPTPSGMEANQEVVDQAREDGKQVEDVAEGPETINEILDGSTRVHETDTNMDDNPYVDDKVEHAHSFAAQTQNEIEAVPKGYVLPEGQYLNQPASLQAGNSNFSGLLSSAVINAIEKIRQEDGSEEKVYLHPSQISGLAFPVEIVIVRKEFGE